MPQYTNALAERAAALEVQASNVFDRGTEARDTGDNYVRTTVILATVLFLIALSQRFRLFGVRAASSPSRWSFSRSPSHRSRRTRGTEIVRMG